MIDELSALKTIRNTQSKWRRSLRLAFVITIIFSSILFVVFPKVLPGLVMQLVMLLSMGSVFGLFFLDRISHFLAKKYLKQDIIHKYLFQHLKPEDLHKDEDLVLELVAKRRDDSRQLKY